MKKRVLCILLLAVLAIPGCGQKEELLSGDVAATATPETTKVPETTETPGATKAPDATATPGATKVPDATGTPETTKTPGVTAAPETTKAPGTTEAPRITNTPDTAETPKTTKAPETTKDAEEPEDSHIQTTATAKPNEPSSQEPKETAPPSGHTHNFVEESSPATCTEAEVITTVCSECGFVSGSRTGQGALGHDYCASTMFAPTCDSYGWEADVCSRCGDSPSGRRLEPLDHNYEVTNVYEGTCRRERVTSYRCRDCGWEMKEVGDYNSDNHEEITSGTYEEIDIDAGEYGEMITYLETSCARCGTVFSVEEIGREPIVPE